MIYEGQHINAIIFDLGGVILNIDYQLPVKAFERLGVTNFQEEFSKASQSNLFDLLETGKIENDAFIEAIRHRLPKEVSDAEIVSAWNSILLDLPESRLFVLEKAAENHRTFLLSNTNAIHIESFNSYLLEEHQLPSLEPFFEKLYLSYEVNLRKPDPRIFEYVIQDAGIDPHSTLFIDDSIQHIESAKSLGLMTHHLVNQDLVDFMDGLL